VASALAVLLASCAAARPRPQEHLVSTTRPARVPEGLAQVIVRTYNACADFIRLEILLTEVRCKDPTIAGVFTPRAGYCRFSLGSWESNYVRPGRYQMTLSRAVPPIVRSFFIDVAPRVETVVDLSVDAEEAERRSGAQDEMLTEMPEIVSDRLPCPRP
jgi:hypothetical protein